ncbi:hypothetical protein ALP79_200142 [Pseudomonas savastanoi pv. fraxini]|nr:hypothetical protein ALP79_200142 [Pseudomonas savastanoi pv. fraxini]
MHLWEAMLQDVSAVVIKVTKLANSSLAPIRVNSDADVCYPHSRKNRQSTVNTNVAMAYFIESLPAL